MSFSKEQKQRYTKQLVQGCETLNIELNSRKIDELIHYLDLLNKWNRSYNLSAIRDPDDMPARHILDSLSILPSLQGRCFIDIGTGAGLPGIPLAICLKDKQFTLLDSNGKKTRFLFQVQQDLKLNNLSIVNQRVEEFQSKDLFDGLLCRAFSSLENTVSSSRHLLRQDGKIFAMKGLIPTDELRELQKHYIVEATQKLVVPGVSGERNLIVIAVRN